MGMLDSIQSGKRRRRRRTLLYGVEGVGKSTFGAMAERSVFLPAEKGLDDIECDSFSEFDEDGKPIPLQSYTKVMECIGELYSGDHTFLHVVIDSADWLERLISRHVCQQRGVESLADIGYGKGPEFALQYWNDLLDGLDALSNHREMGIIFIAHSTVEKFNDPATDTYDRYTPRLHKTASHLIREWCDEVFFTNYKVHTTSKDAGFNKTRTRAVGGDERVIYTSARPSHIAKNRLNMPEEIALDWREYAAFFQTA